MKHANLEMIFSPIPFPAILVFLCNCHPFQIVHAQSRPSLNNFLIEILDQGDDKLVQFIAVVLYMHKLLNNILF